MKPPGLVDLHQQIERLAVGGRGNARGLDVEGDGQQVGLPLDRTLARHEVEGHVVREDILGANQHGSVLLERNLALGEEFERGLMLLVVGLHQLGRHAQRGIHGTAGHVGQTQPHGAPHGLAAQFDRRFALAALALEVGFDSLLTGRASVLLRNRDVVGAGDRREGPASEQASGG